MIRSGITTQGIDNCATGNRADPEAVFAGWNEEKPDEMFPLFSVAKAGHPSYLSSVTEGVLASLHLRIPRTPSPFPNLGSSPWHRLGTELDNVTNARDAVRLAGLDYTVVTRPMDALVKMYSRYSDWGIVREDTGELLGTSDDSHVPIQNVDAFRFFDTLVQTNQASYETAGMIGRGERVWILAKIPGAIKVRGRDIVNKYLLLTNSHDGQSGVRVKLTPIRVVCNNTLTAALQGVGDFTIPRSLAMGEDGQQAASLLEASGVLYGKLDAIFGRMAGIRITARELLDYVMALIPEKEAGDASASDVWANVLALHESGQGASLARGTLWGAYNSVTEYADHLMASTQRASQLESIWFGQGERLKAKAFQLAERMLGSQSIPES
jgi:phage/plasmid-like protein (TIGR03299 family)